MTNHPSVIAFEGDVCIASGELAHVTLAAKKAASRQHHEPILIFDAASGEQVELDLRGTHDDASHRHSAIAFPQPPSNEGTRGPGRPKLGVVAREVTLLPRQWDWLASQPGGASVALRKLVEHAMRANVGRDRTRVSQNAAYRFMSVMAGNRTGFENAARALFAGDAPTFNRLVNAWPKDIRDLTKKLALEALAAEKSTA